jgi:drug/metabolite transporter (DMT)-like permease
MKPFTYPMLNHRGATGVMFAILSPVFLGGTFLFSKIALNELNTRSFLLFWMLTGGIYTGLACIYKRDVTIPKKWLLRIGLIGLGLVEILISSTLFTAVKLAPQPSVVAFLAQFSMVLTVILSVLILKERIRSGAIAGIILLIIGVIILSYTSGAIGWNLLSLVAFSTTGLAVAVLLSKILVQHSSPLIMLMFRNLITAFGGFLVLPGELQFPSMQVWLALAAGALVGPFCGFLFRYLALEQADAWVVATCAMTVPLFVSCYEWIFLGNPLTPSQLFAGLIILSGSFLVAKISAGKRDSDVVPLISK